MTEDKMVGRHHQLNGHEFEQYQEMVKDREDWRAAVHGVTRSWTERLNNNKFSFQSECLLSLCIVVLHLLNLLNNAEYN